MANYLKFPTFKQHAYAMSYASQHSGTGSEESGYEPDADNGAYGSSRYSRFNSNPSIMPHNLKNKYSFYISATNKAGKILKF